MAGRVPAPIPSEEIRAGPELTPRRSHLLAACINGGVKVDGRDSDASLARALVAAGQWRDFSLKFDIDFRRGRFFPLTLDRRTDLLIERAHARRA